MSDSKIKDSITPSKKKPSFSDMLLEIAISIFIPTLILKKLSADDQLGPMIALALALSLPLGYGIYQFIQNIKFGFIPVL